MEITDELADAFVDASRALVGLAVHSVGAAPTEVTVAQFRLLVLVAGAGERTVGDIAEHLGVNHSNASRHCDRLERLGLLARRRSRSDGRVVRVRLTEAGADVVDQVTGRAGLTYAGSSPGCHPRRRPARSRPCAPSAGRPGSSTSRRGRFTRGEPRGRGARGRRAGGRGRSPRAWS